MLKALTPLSNAVQGVPETRKTSPLGALALVADERPQKRVRFDEQAGCVDEGYIHEQGGCDDGNKRAGDTVVETANGDRIPIEAQGRLEAETAENCSRWSERTTDGTSYSISHPALKRTIPTR